MDRDFQKVLQALTAFDKKISTLEGVVKNMAEATTTYATSQQNLNKEQAGLNKELGEGMKLLSQNIQEIVKFLCENLSQIVKYLKLKEGN